jgi:hypothetical protein
VNGNEVIVQFDIPVSREQKRRKSMTRTTRLHLRPLERLDVDNGTRNRLVSRRGTVPHARRRMIRHW